jgi:uncharacterized membrane protein
MPKFCTNCGAALTAEAARFCNKCGAAVTPTQPTATQAPPASPSFAPPPSQPAPGYPPSRPAASGLQPNMAAALCYLLWLITGVIFLALDPYNKDRFVRFHAFQAIFFSVAWVVVLIVISLLSAMLVAIFPWPIDIIFEWLPQLASLGFLLAWLFLMYKAYSQEMYKLPVIGELAMKQAG